MVKDEGDFYEFQGRPAVFLQMLLMYLLFINACEDGFTYSFVIQNIEPAAFLAATVFIFVVGISFALNFSFGIKVGYFLAAGLLLAFYEGTVFGGCMLYLLVHRDKYWTEPSTT